MRSPRLQPPPRSPVHGLYTMLRPRSPQAAALHHLAWGASSRGSPEDSMVLIGLLSSCFRHLRLMSLRGQTQGGRGRRMPRTHMRRGADRYRSLRALLGHRSCAAGLCLLCSGCGTPCQLRLAARVRGARIPAYWRLIQDGAVASGARCRHLAASVNAMDGASLDSVLACAATGGAAVMRRWRHGAFCLPLSSRTPLVGVRVPSGRESRIDMRLHTGSSHLVLVRAYRGWGWGRGAALDTQPGKPGKPAQRARDVRSHNTACRAMV